jgi:hypothetical protein
MEIGDLALGQGDQRDAGEAEPLVQRRDVLLVAGEAVERLSNRDVELALACPLQHELITGPDRRGAAQRTIDVGMLVDPALALDEGPALSNLVLNRGIALAVGAVARVDDRLGRGSLVI